MTLDDILKQLAGLSEEEKAQAIAVAARATADKLWVPNPGPQTDAYFCEADELFYGGQAGGGKSDLALGLALNEHTRALLLRRTNKEAAGLFDRLVEITGSDNANRSSHTYKRGEQIVEIGGCEHEDDKQKRKGVPHDLKAFDEIGDFTETQYTFICGWNRSTKPGQRCRILATGNPPTKPEGLWVLKRWAPWLDPAHPNPAQPGELRWYTTLRDGTEAEVDGPGPHIIDGEALYARSRTFIPAALSDNPDLAVTNYRAILDSLPEELRRAYRDGNFTASMQDDAMQCIPTAWVADAQQRWTPTPTPGVPMCGMGVDVAQGGDDRTVLARRHDGWYAPLLTYPGKQTPNGMTVSGLVISNRRDGAKVIIDVGGGWGGEAYAHLAANGVPCTGYMGVKKSDRRTQDNLLKFANVRTEAYWRFREALDPRQAQGSIIALPRDAEMVADLCAPRYEVRGHGPHAVIHLESKDEVKDRIGRSPDKGDAVVMAWFDGLKQTQIAGGWPAHNAKRLPEKAVMSNRYRRFS